MAGQLGRTRGWAIGLWVVVGLAVASGCVAEPRHVPHRGSRVNPAPPEPVAAPPGPAASPPGSVDPVGLVQRSGDLILRRDPLRAAPTNYADLGYSCLALLGASRRLEAIDPERARRFRVYGLTLVDHLVRDKDMNRDGRTGWGLDYAYRDQSTRATIPAHQEYAFQTGIVGYCLLEAYEHTREERYLSTVREAVRTFWDASTFTVDRSCGNCSYFWYSTHPNYHGRLVKNTNVLMGMVVARLARLTGDPAYRLRAQQVFNSERYEIEVRRNFNYFGFNDPKHVPNREKHLAPEMWAFDEMAHQLGTDEHRRAIGALVAAYWSCGERCGANITQVPGILAGCALAHYGEPSRKHCWESIAQYSSPYAKVDNVALVAVVKALPVLGVEQP